ncbi:MAG: hypothetical protein F6K19_50725 [Cyanothece sp. SIO1E1]|nr:hypothetical protein [Cyanothece sp. SIO1E1]
MTKKSKRIRFGRLPPKYHFALNPYPEFRSTRCSNCQNKTGQRKLPLIIRVDPWHLIALNYTNRYCNRCDLLIAHQHEIEHYLAEMFLQRKPEVIGNSYLIFGTVDKKVWREQIEEPKPPEEIRQYVHDFKSYQTIRMSMRGWFREGEQPPEMEPPPSAEWVKK